MPEQDNSDQHDTQIIEKSMINRNQLPHTPKRVDGLVVLPDGSNPVPMGSGHITGILGEGGMAIVYEIWNEPLGVKRAIKLLRPNSGKENRERFDKEVKLTAQLDHPNIIKIHSVGQWHNLPYIEMEMVDGISLEELIKKRNSLPMELCISIGVVISRALNYTHNHEYIIDNRQCIGLLHRDLKPGNILFSRTGKVRLTDFGIATPGNIASDSSSGKIVGSMQYLAPEQLEEGEIDTRADIFAFGCILYEMATGEKVFPERNITKLVKQRLKNEFKSLSSYHEISIPPKMVSIINQCLEYDSQKRPEAIGLIQSDLETLHKSLFEESAEKIIKEYATGKRQNPKSTETHIKIKKKPLSLQRIALIVILSVFILGGSGIIFHIKNIQKNGADNISSQQNSTVTSTIISNEVLLDNAEKENNQIPKKMASVSKKRVAKPTKKRYPSKAKKVKHPSTVFKKKPVAVSTFPTQTQTDNEIFVDSDEEIDINGNIIDIKTSDSQTELEKFFSEYEVSDPVSLLKKLDRSKKYKKLLNIYNQLPQGIKTQKEIRILKHRALVNTNQVNKSYYDNNHLNDGEFYLSKAQFLYKHRQYQRAIWILGIVKTAPTVLANKIELNKEVLLYAARCHSKILIGSPADDKKKNAMESWFNVKNAFKSEQSHKYFIEANKEIRRISKIEI